MLFCFLLTIKFMVFYLSGASQDLNSPCELNKANCALSPLIKRAMADRSGLYSDYFLMLVMGAGEF